MLRAILGLALLLFVAGVAYYAGRSSVAPTVATVPDVVTQSIPEAAPQDTPATDQTRSRIDPQVPQELPPPPAVSADTSLTPPPLPRAEGQAQVAPAAATTTLGDPSGLKDRVLGLPIAGLKLADIHDTFNQARDAGERLHEAADIMAPKGTPVLAVDNGIVAKLFNSKPGGLTVYQFDPAQKYAYYYAHLDRYAEGLKEGMLLKKGDKVGYVGVTGNSDPNAPHLHFAIFELGPEKRWWEGKPVNPYPLLVRGVRK